MRFETDREINKWLQDHREKCVFRTTAGEQFVYEFIPTGIIECQTVRCLFCGEKCTRYVD